MCDALNITIINRQSLSDGFFDDVFPVFLNSLLNIIAEDNLIEDTRTQDRHT